MKRLVGRLLTAIVIGGAPLVELRFYTWLTVTKRVEDSLFLAILDFQAISNLVLLFFVVWRRNTNL